MEECREVVATGWIAGETSSRDERQVGTVVKLKLNNCRRNLIKWSKSTFRNAAKEITRLKARLQELLYLSQHDINWEEIKEIRLAIDHLWRQGEAYLSQRSRIKRLKNREKNSEFFHATTTQRMSMNILERIQN